MGLRVEIHRDLQLNDELTTFWKRHQWHPHGDLDYVRFEHKTRSDSWDPFIIAIRNDREILACVAGRIQRLPLKLQFGYRIFQGPVLTTLVAHRVGFMGGWQYALYDFLLARLQPVLSSGLIDAILFRGIPLASPLHAIAAGKTPLLRREYFRVIQEHWVLKGIHSFEDFLKSHRAVRRNFKKCSNRLERVIGKNKEIRCYNDRGTMQLMIEHSEEIARKTWQRNLIDFSFLDNAVHPRYRFCYEKGWGRAYILYLNGLPAAFLHGILYHGVYYGEKMGYDPAFRHLSVGTYLMMNVIGELCRSGAVQSMEFGTGNSEDKRRYCDSSFELADIHIVGPGIRLWPSILLRLLAQGSNQLAKSIWRQLGCYQSTRKRWRHGSRADRTN